MAGYRSTKAIAAAIVAALGAAGAVWAGAPPAAALLALLAGVAAFALMPSGDSAEAQPAAPDAAAVSEDGPNLLAAFDDPLLVVRERRVMIANPAAKALLGAHIEGSDVRLAIRHPAAAEHLAGDEGTAVRTELVGLGDVERPWEMIVAPLPDGSRLVRLADQSQARAAEQMRVDFVANASHELRTPLATLLGFLETLQEDIEPETQARFIGIMSGEAVRMRDLLDDLMSLSRIEADRFTLPRDKVELLPLVEEVKRALKPIAKGRGITIHDRTQAGAGAVTGDRGQLAQMMTNLVVNALKYGRAGTPVRIHIEDAETDLVSLDVIDRGEGIAADHIPRLTERFYRVDPGRSRQVGGTGLGLAIVKHIVLRHRGRLEIRSVIGEGTTVSVTLPRADRQPKAVS